MNWIQTTLANLLLRGKITVEFPNEILAQALQEGASERLQEAAAVLCDETLSDSEKLKKLSELLL